MSTLYFPAYFDVSSFTTKRLQPFSSVLLAIATKMSYEHYLTTNSWRLIKSIKLGSIKFMLYEVTKSLIYKAEKS